MIRKHVRTGSAIVVDVACQASSLPASTASSSSSASTDPSGEAKAASHASTGPLVLGSPSAVGRRAVGGEPAGQCIREAPDEGAEHIARYLRLRFAAGGIVGAGEGARSQERGGERPRQSLDPTTVSSVDERTPSGPPTACGAFE